MKKDKEWLDKALLEQSFDVLTKPINTSNLSEILEWAFNKLSPEDPNRFRTNIFRGFFK